MPKLNDQSFRDDSFIFEVPWQRGGRNLKLHPFSPHVPLILLQAFPFAHFPHSLLQFLL